jgi:Tfp pilus assembly protein PilZ
MSKHKEIIPTIFLASRTEQENMLLRRKLESLRDELGELRFVSLHPQGLAASADEPVSVVVINLHDWSPADALWLRGLRNAGYEGPVMIIAKGQASDVMSLVDVADGAVFLEKPYEIKDLLGIAQKMLNAARVAQRIHRRFQTDQDAQIEFFGRDGSYATKVFNMSRGGAYLETRDLAPIRAGDMLRVHMDLTQLNRSYTMPARVVWTKRSSRGRGTSVGVEFVGPGDIKKTLVGSI